MALIKLHAYKNQSRMEMGTEEIIINTNSIHKMKEGSVFSPENKKYYRATDLYLNEWVAKWEPKKHYVVAEMKEDIMEIANDKRRIEA